MKRLIGLALAIVGGVGTLWGAFIFLSGSRELMLGYPPLYPALASVALLTVGVLTAQNR